jgi:hypothetical protein
MDRDEMQQRLRAFMLDYLQVCHKHGMCISTTEGGGQTIAQGGWNAPDALVGMVRDLWPTWDSEALEYIGFGESHERFEGRRVRDHEREERATFERLKQKYGSV